MKNQYKISYANFGEPRLAILPTVDKKSLRVAEVIIIRTHDFRGVVTSYEVREVIPEGESRIPYSAGKWVVPKKLIGKDRDLLEKQAFMLLLKDKKHAYVNDL